MPEPTWIIIPVLNNLEMSLDAISDALNQSVPTRVLVINQGSTDEVRRALERESEQRADRLFIWSHMPPLLSLSATWNRALRFCWETGADKTLVVNNDCRLNSGTGYWLSRVLHREQALFVSCVGVTAEQYDPAVIYDDHHFWDAHSDKENTGYLLSKGGPDFSCYLISKECHDKYPFDEQFIPCFCEDLDLHRRIMLAGEGSRIFSINLPYLHLASQTLKRMSPEHRAAIEGRINGLSRKYYERKWGGGVNEEKFWTPFNEYPASPPLCFSIGTPGPTTPELQAYVQQKEIG